MNGPVTAGSSLSRPSRAEQRGDPGAAADQVAPKAASGRHPGVCTFTLTHVHAHVHTHARADTPSKPTCPRANPRTHSHTSPLTPNLSLIRRWGWTPAHAWPPPWPPGGGRPESQRDFPLPVPRCLYPEGARSVGEGREDSQLSTYCVPCPNQCSPTLHGTKGSTPIHVAPIRPHLHAEPQFQPP